MATCVLSPRKTQPAVAKENGDGARTSNSRDAPIALAKRCAEQVREACVTARSTSSLRDARLAKPDG
jgi:hypothetical protein